MNASHNRYESVAMNLVLGGLHLRHLANSNSPPSGIGNQQISWPKIEIH